MLIILLFGLAIGSFVNAAVWRLHEQAKSGSKKPEASSQNKKKLKNSGRRTPNYSIWRGRSMCPKCGHQLAAKDLIPLLSWLRLRGNCRYCHQPISIQYPLVEALTAVLFIWSYLAWDFSGTLSILAFSFWLVTLTGLIILAIYDLRWMILPDRVLRVLFGLTGVYLITISIFNQSLAGLGSHLVAAALAGLFFYSLYFLGRGRWMGGGDVKLATLMGLILGTSKALVAFFLGFNLAAVYSLALIAAKRLNRKDIIPFGPFLIAATVIAMLYGRQLFNLYLDLFLLN